MRKLTQLPSAAHAQSLSEALQREDIASTVRQDDAGGHSVWVLEERSLGDAREVLASWAEAPLPVSAPEPSDETAAPPAPAPPRADRPRTGTRGRGPRGVYVSMRLRSAGAPITVGAILVSVVIALLSDFGADPHVLAYLTIKEQFTTPGDLYADIAAGEVWRLATPALIHFGFLHLVFNAFWLLDIGGAIERAFGSLHFLSMVLVSAVLSNLAQLHFGQSAAFGGLSGVVYACIGYLWARGRFDPRSPVGAPPQLMAFFVIYLVLGFSGVFDALFGRMANYCHLGGLIAGGAYGLLAALRSRKRLRHSA